MPPPAASDAAVPAGYRADLGETTLATQQFRQVLTHVRAREGDVSEEAVDLRRNIAMLLLAEGNREQAEAELISLYENLELLYGPDHEAAREIAERLWLPLSLSRRRGSAASQWGVSPACRWGCRLL
ncbi:hypothetical protein GCM10012284_46340 [Mangrovihabitans endophyticus]|uniref:Tetratricopeptide repeat-containing protein n=1 Tax=Mangrovihabitans endophyticus TaxID=1751298 RepID=A0A8J3C1X4_9ACTN|nr:hypothetical protein GCM10012284_46340 [Mangrovihabitans endophyticus]